MLTAQSMDWTIEPQGVPEMFMDSNWLLHAASSVALQQLLPV